MVGFRRPRVLSGFARTLPFAPFSSYNDIILHIISVTGGTSMTDNIAERAIIEGKYIFETKKTVRATAQHFDISKSTVHTVVTY